MRGGRGGVWDERRGRSRAERPKPPSRRSTKAPERAGGRAGDRPGAGPARVKSSVQDFSRRPPPPSDLLPSQPTSRTDDVAPPLAHRPRTACRPSGCPAPASSPPLPSAGAAAHRHRPDRPGATGSPVERPASDGRRFADGSVRRGCFCPALLGQRARRLLPQPRTGCAGPRWKSALWG